LAFSITISDFLRTFVDQEDDQIALGMIGRDRVRDVLHQHGLAGARRRHDQCTLTLADRCDDVDHPGRKVLSGGVFQLHPEALIRKQRREVVEVDLVLGLFRILEIQRVDLEKSEVALAFLGAANMAFDGVAGAKTETADLRRRDIDVVRPRQIIGIRRA
jgi:hypothetical protein